MYSTPVVFIALSLFAFAVLIAQVGCQCAGPQQPALTAHSLVVAAPGDKPAPGQKLFPSDQAAAAALLAAVKEQNHHQLQLIFGPGIKALASGDKVEDHRHFEQFVAHAKKRFQLEKENPSTSIVLIGDKVWPFPIPILRLPDGKWFFDTTAGKPDKYGASGVMTFIVNQQGQVYQKNLGLQTIARARNIRSYDPDTSWTPVK